MGLLPGVEEECLDLISGKDLGGLESHELFLDFNFFFYIDKIKLFYLAKGSKGGSEYDEQYAVVFL